jgi:hypothetical protein
VVVRKRPGPVMDQGRNPVNSLGGRTTRLDRPMVRTNRGGCFGSENTGQRWKAKRERVV